MRALRLDLSWNWSLRSSRLMSRSRPLYSVRSGVKTWDNDSSSREKLPRLLGRDGFRFLLFFINKQRICSRVPVYRVRVCVYIYMQALVVYRTGLRPPKIVWFDACVIFHSLQQQQQLLQQHDMCYSPSPFGCACRSCVQNV